MKSESVLQEWVTALPLREQGTLLTAVRGCDDEPKTWTNTGVAYSPGRRLTAFIRYCFMNPADPREVDYAEGSFFRSQPPAPFKPSEFGHLPQHWYSQKIRLIDLTGGKVLESDSSELEDKTNTIPYAIIFSNRVFIFALNVGEWQHYREVKAARIRYVETASTFTPTPNEKGLYES